MYLLTFTDQGEYLVGNFIKLKTKEMIEIRNLDRKKWWKSKCQSKIIEGVVTRGWQLRDLWTVSFQILYFWETRNLLLCLVGLFFHRLNIVAPNWKKSRKTSNVRYGGASNPAAPQISPRDTRVMFSCNVTVRAFCFLYDGLCLLYSFSFFPCIKSQVWSYNIIHNICNARILNVNVFSFLGLIVRKKWITYLKAEM